MQNVERKNLVKVGTYEAKLGETNHEDCVLCHCDDVLNKMSCEKITCCEPKSNNPVIPEGKCCPECQGQESSEGCRGF